MSGKGRGETPFCPRRAAKGREEHLCQVIVLYVREGTGGNTFLSAKGREGPRRTPLPGHSLVCPGRDGGKHLFVREGPRRAAKGREGPRRTPLQGHSLVCPGRDGGKHLFVREGPRRAAKNTFARHCEQSSLHVNGTWSVVRTFGPEIDQETDFGNIHVFQSRVWERPVERPRS